VVDPAQGVLTGTVEIAEVVAPVSDPTKPVLWIAKGRPITLHAHYSAGSGEVYSELDLKFKWYLIQGSQFTELGENDGPLNYIPSVEVDEIEQSKIRVEVYDLNGKAAIAKEYPYIVQNCVDNLLPALHINTNNRCHIDGLRASAYVIDSLDDNRIYSVKKIGSKWWLTENLRADKQTNAWLGYRNQYGAYYPAVNTVIEGLGSLDGKYCPKGWRIPSKEEWDDLDNTINISNSQLVFKELAVSDTEAAPPIGSRAWNSQSITNIPGINTVGFNLIPAGIYTGSAVNASGNSASFFMLGGGQIQNYGNELNSPEPGGVFVKTINGTYWYTARCVSSNP
jgi:uncharacterized protein (TIGR02145 family)